MTTLKKEVLQFIQDELTYEEDSLTIENDTELLISGILDSLGVMQLVTFISNQYGYTVPAGDIVIENFSSVTKLAEYLLTHIES